MKTALFALTVSLALSPLSAQAANESNGRGDPHDDSTSIDVSYLEAQLSATDAVASNNASRLDVVEVYVGQAAEAQAKTQAQVDANTSAIGVVSQQLSAVSLQSEAVTQIEGRVASNADRLGTVEAGMGTTQEQIASTASRVDQHGAAIAANSAQISTQAEGVAVNAAGIAQNAKAVIEVNGRIDHTDQVVSAQSDQLLKAASLVSDLHGWTLEQFQQANLATARNAAEIRAERQARVEGDRRLEAGIAGVAAMIPVFDPNYSGLQTHVGAASYASAHAIGISLGGAVSSRDFVHAGASLPSRGDSVFNAGWSRRW